MFINILLDFERISEEAYVYARSENEIDFFTSPIEAARCTMSFAAVELKEKLSSILIDAQIKITNKKEIGATNIELRAKSFEGRGECYTLLPTEDGALILGDGRVGVLYGVYEFLKMQGYFWFEPGKAGEYCPPKTNTLIFPQKKKRYTTTSPIGRGFSIDGRLNENEELFLWMARNRLNVYFNFPNTSRLAKKLGFILRDGGHIFENILNPEKITSSGKALYEEHEEWYGLPKTGKRIREKALRTQFCVSKPDLLLYLAEELLRNINGRWREAEEINVWGFDTWGGICTCPDCQKIGNATDQTFFMASYFRDFLNKARREGRLSRDIRMVLCSYEGSDTIAPPTKPVPENLIKAGDHILFAPIVRCYEHTFDNKDCSYNSYYDKHLEGWEKLEKSIPLSILEYYNVTKFEDLPLLFLDTMKKDFVHYHKRGARGFSYMHIPMVNWGVRALTHMLYAELSWDYRCNTDKLISKYFLCRYGKYSDKMRSIYKKISKAAAPVSSFRAWKTASLLEKLMNWDGKIPTEPLDVDDHFATPEGFEIKGEATVMLYKNALSAIEKIISEEKKNYLGETEIKEANNPEELLKNGSGERVLNLLLDDKRGLIYGYDSFNLLYLTGCYYNALYNRNTERASTLWRKIEAVEERLESYYLPATYTASLIAMISKDALTRTQLKDTIMRCRSYRNKNKLT